MRLRDLSRSQAIELLDSFLQQLIDAGVRQLNSEHKRITNGLYFHASNIGLTEMLDSSVASVREYAQSQLDHWTPVVDECEPYVNNWLEQNIIDGLLVDPVNVSTFKPLTRDEVHEDN